MRELPESVRTYLRESRERLAAIKQARSIPWDKQVPDWKDIKPSAELTELLCGQDAERAAIPDAKE